MKTQEEYLDEYISLMEVARNRTTPEGYTEKHHIFPKSWMPNDYLVVLTAQEHFTAHYLLHKAFPEDNGMATAFWLMCNMKKVGRDYQVSAEIYAEAKKACAKATSERMTGNVPSAETRAKIGKAHRGKKVSAESRAKMRENRKDVSGKNNSFFGKKHTPESIAKQIAAQTGSKHVMTQITCLHCNRTMAKNNYPRYHGDNCKLK